uniref:(northern house mosquito) hypothetical protein n=1 Tax=Culex pipiens TaxID=7175 RepID=A0A8D8IB30_CULPI
MDNVPYQKTLTVRQSQSGMVYGSVSSYQVNNASGLKANGNNGTPTGSTGVNPTPMPEPQPPYPPPSVPPAPRPQPPGPTPRPPGPFPPPHSHPTHGFVAQKTRITPTPTSVKLT